MNGEGGVEDFCFVEEFKLGPNYGKIYKTTLTDNSIIYERAGNEKGEKIVNTILLSDVIGASSKTGDDGMSFIHIYSYPLKKRKFVKQLKRRRVEHVFCVGGSADNTAVAEKWINAIKWLLSKKCDLNTAKGQGSPPKLQFLVFINPFGGQGIAQKLFNKNVRPMLDEAEVDYEVKITEYADHAKAIIQNFDDVMKLDCILSCSGDGLLHEIVNGLMNRADYKDAIKTPLGHIPCGSGNGLCASALHHSGEPFDVTSSVFTVLTGTPAPLDIVKAETSNSEIHYSFLGIAMGFVADIDVESEKYRYMGDTRFVYMAVKNIMKRRRFSGKVWYLPLDDYDHTDNQEPFNCHHHEQLTESHQLHGDVTELSNVTFQEQPLENEVCASGIQNVHLPNIHDPLPNSWKCIEGNFIGWSFVTLSHIGKDVYLVPGAELGGGIIYCVYLAGDMTRKELLAVFTKIEQGEHLHVPGINVIKARAFRLEPYSAPSKIITIDGECLEYGKLQAEVYKGLGRVRCRHETLLRS